MITDDYMMELLQQSRDYSLVILKAGPHKNMPGADKIIWEHARRNFELRQAGVLSVVCPVRDGSDLSGIGIFKGSPDEIKEVMEADPGVQEGVFIYEIHPCRSFPGDQLT